MRGNTSILILNSPYDGTVLQSPVTTAEQKIYIDDHLGPSRRRLCQASFDFHLFCFHTPKLGPKAIGFHLELCEDRRSCESESKRGSLHLTTVPLETRQAADPDFDRDSTGKRLPSLVGGKEKSNKLPQGVSIESPEVQSSGAPETHHQLTPPCT